MIKQQYFISILLCLLSFTAFSQNKKLVILDQLADGKTYNVINYKGKIIWQIPAGHRPFINQNNSAFGDFMFTYFKQFDFTKSPLPIQTKDGIYLLNIKGEKIKDFGTKYTRINPAAGGFLRGYEPIEGRSGSSMIIYLDKEGNEVFNGNKYWEASPFSEGYAAVQPVESGPWHIIDEKGNKVADFPKNLSKYIKTAQPFSDGLTLLLLKRPRGYDRQSFVYQSIYFNTKGEEVLDVYNITGAYYVNTKSFKNGIGYCLHNGKAYFYDTKGNVLPHLEEVLSVRNITKNHISLFQEVTYKLLLLDKELNPVLVPFGEHESVDCYFVTDDYICAMITDTIMKKSMYHIFDSKKMKDLYETDRMIIGMVNDNVLIGKNEGYDKKLIAIESLKHKELYSLSPENRLFRSVAEALPFKNKVSSLVVKDGKDIEKITGFTNLKILKIEYFKGETLPGNIENLQQLELLDLFHCKKLTHLPTSLSKLKALKELRISSCTNIKGIEKMILASPQLERVFTQNYTFEKGFIKRMKKERPNLRIDNWHSGGDDDMIFEDTSIDVEVEEISPPPAPQKEKN